MTYEVEVVEWLDYVALSIAQNKYSFIVSFSSVNSLLKGHLSFMWKDQMNQISAGGLILLHTQTALVLRRIILKHVAINQETNC